MWGLIIYMIKNHWFVSFPVHRRMFQMLLTVTLCHYITLQK